MPLVEVVKLKPLRILGHKIRNERLSIAALRVPSTRRGLEGGGSITQTGVTTDVATGPTLSLIPHKASPGIIATLRRRTSLAVPQSDANKIRSGSRCLSNATPLIGSVPKDLVRHSSVNCCTRSLPLCAGLPRLAPPRPVPRRSQAISSTFH